MTSETQTNPSYVGARPDLLALMSPDWSRALDVGCAEGALGSALKSDNPNGEITGIELDPNMASVAGSRLDRVLSVDAMTALNDLTAAGEEFDLVCCGDVLEHLEDPWTALRKIRALCPRGEVIVSLPNIGHWTTLFSLAVRGYWPYRDRGIHDRTHLRFFARNNLREFFRDAGFTDITIRTTHRLFERPGGWSRRLGRICSWIPIVRLFTAYQFLCVLR